MNKEPQTFEAIAEQYRELIAELQQRLKCVEAAITGDVISAEEFIAGLRENAK